MIFFNVGSSELSTFIKFIIPDIHSVIHIGNIHHRILLHSFVIIIIVIVVVVIIIIIIIIIVVLSQKIKISNK